MLVALNLKAIVREGIYSCANPKQKSPSSQFNINSSNFNNMIFNHNPKMAQSGSNTISAFERMRPQQHLKREERFKATVAFSWGCVHSFRLNFFLIEVAKEYAEEWTQIPFQSAAKPSEDSNKGQVLCSGTIWIQCYTTTCVYAKGRSGTQSTLYSFYSGESLNASSKEITRPRDEPFFPPIIPSFAPLFSSPANSPSPETNSLPLLLPWKCPTMEDIFFSLLWPLKQPWLRRAQTAVPEPDAVFHDKSFGLENFLVAFGREDVRSKKFRLLKFWPKSTMPLWDFPYES